jgi:nucleoside-diphosphate-sugar epimerase
MKQPNTFITGGSGFLGQSLIKRLVKSGGRVHCLTRQHISVDNQECTFHFYDGTYSSVHRALKESKATQVYHLASAIVREHNPEDLNRLMDANILLGTQLLEAMSRLGASKIVNTGTYWQFDDRKTYRPKNLYAATKKAFQDILEYYCQRNRISALTLIVFDTYGPGDNRDKVIPYLINCSKNGTVAHLKSKQQLLNLVHICDAVDGLIKGMSLPRPNRQEMFLLNHKNYITLEEVVSRLEETSLGPIKVEWSIRNQPANLLNTEWDIPTLPEWHPKFLFPEGID